MSDPRHQVWSYSPLECCIAPITEAIFVVEGLTKAFENIFTLLLHIAGPPFRVLYNFASRVGANSSFCGRPLKKAAVTGRATSCFAFVIGKCIRAAPSGSCRGYPLTGRFIGKNNVGCCKGH